MNIGEAITGMRRRSLRTAGMVMIATKEGND